MQYAVGTEVVNVFIFRQPYVGIQPRIIHPGKYAYALLQLHIDYPGNGIGTVLSRSTVAQDFYFFYRG